jgi:hypothetical protein
MDRAMAAAVRSECLEPGIGPAAPGLSTVWRLLQLSDLTGRSRGIPV